jgi:hypothetical protein
LYTCTSIRIPSIENVGFWGGSYSAFGFHYGWVITKLWNIHIANNPVLIDDNWRYKLIVVFDSFMAILSTKGFAGNDKLIVLKHGNLAPGKYVDAAWSYEHIFAVTSNIGNVFVCQPYVVQYGITY